MKIYLKHSGPAGITSAHQLILDVVAWVFFLGWGVGLVMCHQDLFICYIINFPQSTGTNKDLAKICILKGQDLSFQALGTK